ncbi:ATP-binding protein [Brevundimonas subvibrioides]|uniref:histidine kinase n=1 Tax=Brevundimonas subvibrioides (strain ATCC 15264 / DSM 4735 / LMG 14903 / NBRC 16000 / CB 81) TaxID=633149 RepID=D9QFN2_BRESC|nr:ATP-binding protein [Brevundimonas subvibrioides]ADL00596.1 integral membrane sensor signal transduction histidine kinase [Brevundimonas subvibrioides ATCC 15264]
MKNPLSSLSVLVQVALLAVFAVIATQAVTFAVVLLAPAPRPAGFSISAAADALQGKPAETSDGRTLRRSVSAQPGVTEVGPGPIETGITMALAQRLGVPVSAVKVRLAPERTEFGNQRRGPGPRLLDGQRDGRVEIGERRMERFVITQAPGQVPPGPPPTPPDRRALEEALGRALIRLEPLSTGQAGPNATPPEVTVQLAAPGDRQTRFTVLADRLTFTPFAASLRLPDGRWATVEPPHGLIDPWQMRLLIALGITALLLAPLVWLMARRLTRPIRVFAQAAERLGADPDAPPLTPAGPSEVRTAITAFNDMQAAIRGHMRQRTQTIAAIAHDLRTPLTRLRFRAEQAPDALRDKMASDVEEMDALIAQAMAFVRGEAQTERREPLDLAAIAETCASGFAETGAAVAFVGGKSLPVTGDPAALRRAVANLIDNAVKFAGTARVEASRQGDRAVITVSDGGPGLADDELDAVFEPFHRGERSRNRQTGGAGLGLAVARQAARAAGGDVTLSNRPGGGLEARLSVPLTG